MHKAVIFALCGTLTATLIPAHAQVYQWKDANGKTVISDTPPPANSKSARSLTSGGTIERTAPEGAAPESPKTMADKDMEFKKRQQEAKEKADKRAKEEANAKEKQTFCEQARRQIDLIQSGRPLAVADESNGQQFMNNDQRDQEVERLNRQMAEHCK